MTGLEIIRAPGATAEQIADFKERGVISEGI